MVIIAIVDINILQEHNPWWRRQEIILEDSFIVELSRLKFTYYHPLYQTLPINKDAVLTLRGPRRIGKTTLIRLLIKRLLLKDRLDRENVFFFPCDTLKDYKELEEVLRIYLDFIRPKTDKRIFIFLDEISFVNSWQITVKYLVDSGKLKNSLLLLTGSNILDLKFSSERLPGRRGEIFPWDLTYLPLNFADFIKLVSPKLIASPASYSLAQLPQFQKFFSDYLACGGFPATINEYFAKNYISTPTYEIFLAWIEGDLHKVGKSDLSAYQILDRVFTHITTPISDYKLSKEAGIASHTTVEEYLDILEKMFIICRLPYFSIDERRVYFRKNNKIYFNDPFIFNTLLAKIRGFSSESFAYTARFIDEAKNRPMLVENTVSAHLKRRFSNLYFGRSSQDREIDFVGFQKGKYIYFEVKYQKEVAKEEFSWTKNLLGREKISVLTKKNYQSGKINLVPAEIFLGYF